MTVTYSSEYCQQCGKISPRETETRPGDDGGKVRTEYCKACKGFNRVETDASGRIVQEQYAI